MNINGFQYCPSKYVPFRDEKVLEKCRNMSREELTVHPNPEFKIRILTAKEIEHMWLTDMFFRIKNSYQRDERLVMLLPNPTDIYRKVAYLINKFNINCKNVYMFALDEYANENGEVAPDTWKFGFVNAMKKNFYYQIEEDLRPPSEQVIGPTTKNIENYGDMIADLGGADISYTGPGWTGHLAFVEPDSPEFEGTLSQWKQMGPRIVTLSPFTLAQNSLHGSFGMSGDIAIVPPKAATIGPADIVAAKHRIDISSITVHNTATSWQRLITRLVSHGPVTPLLPTSIHQELRTDFYISEENAKNIHPDWDKGY
jgi:glucosamine-6-phosphate deaminase